MDKSQAHFSPDPRAPWWEQFLLQTLTIPGGIAIIFSLVLLGMFMGILPSTLSNKVDALDAKDDIIMQQHVDLKTKLESENLNILTQTRLLRGICILLAKTQSEQLSYCNF